MSVDFVISARNVIGDGFGVLPGSLQFLFVPESGEPSPGQAQDKKAWADAVVAQATHDHTPSGAAVGDILFFIHGYNNSPDSVLEKHRRLKNDLNQRGFVGVVASFDWPSGDIGINYLPDLINARQSALHLVNDGILLLSQYQQPNCQINLHILAHSMGAYLVREAFSDADHANEIAVKNWMTSQILLIGGDVSSSSLAADDRDGKSVYRHCARLTNYSNRHDTVLGLSNVKRFGVAPRVGRVGLPDEAPGTQAVNVDCSPYWETIPETQKVYGNRHHSWHFGDPVFTDDLLSTIKGVDRNSMPTRRMKDGKLLLQKP